MKKCEMCGGELPTDKTNRRRFCDDCRVQRNLDYEKRRQDEAKANKLFSQVDKKIDHIAKNATKAVKIKGTSLTQLLKSLDEENASRRAQGVAPLSYGKYVSLISNGKLS